MTMMFVEGNEAIARGALAAGCRFFAGYPITPATSIYHQMLHLLPPAGGVCMQGEDEIASIGFCLGASMTGAKTMTATSGPGISLYSEQLSFAIGGEIPLVIVDVQRLGPSTGSATKGADGDIQFLRWGNSGGLPVIVLAPVDVRDCYLLTVHAFNLAEQYRCPVFIASNKEIGMTRESVDFAGLILPEPVDRKLCPDDHSGRPFAPLPGEFTPPFLPIAASGGSRLSRQTSSSHGEDGYITTDSGAIEAGILRMQDKLVAAVGDFTFYEYDGTADDSILVVVYGVTARAARTAVRQLREMGSTVSLLILKTLYPVPEECIREHLKGKAQVFVVEMNLGQYVREIERLAGTVPVRFYGRMNGELINPKDIVEQVMS
ncbi:MAG: pyruvate flavodoxin/ferredoxin oxidoreductase domain protein [Desulfobulbaceae bacterium BRH_c16a]|nr:MAG: pyruvate flavodoxin/ferredoxin oxidoreductase domain protein [Desulfobulbaceae bacterium BRH_c16a]